MYKKILCPVDGSTTSDCGMLEAINLAKDQNAKIEFLHVIDHYFPIVDMSGGGVNYADLTEILRESGSKILKKAEDAARLSGVSTNSKLAESMGQISRTIIDEAKQYQADLIVMGTHGTRGFERLMMGSDAETVVRTSPVPVLLVKDKKALKETS
jgi:nucleotide-binding universal stress UspA family protein